jgi:hypothetical protein
LQILFPNRSICLSLVPSHGNQIRFKPLSPLAVLRPYKSILAQSLRSALPDWVLILSAWHWDCSRQANHQFTDYQEVINPVRYLPFVSWVNQLVVTTCLRMIWCMICSGEPPLRTCSGWHHQPIQVGRYRGSFLPLSVERPRHYRYRTGTELMIPVACGFTDHSIFTCALLAQICSIHILTVPSESLPAPGCSSLYQAGFTIHRTSKYCTRNRDRAQIYYSSATFQGLVKTCASTEVAEDSSQI